MTDQQLTETELFIDGVARPASSGNRYDLYNPARPEELVGHAASADAAHKAFPDWADLSYRERGEKLKGVAAALTEDPVDVDFRSRLFCREHGKILRETHLEISRLGERFSQCGDYALRLERDELVSGPPFDTLISRQARGVAALIVPWNWPLAILGAKLPQALMAGNTVVVKPANNSSLATTLTLHRIAALLPRGVVNVLTGSSGRIGDPLVGHPLVRKVNFTGSVDVGRHVMKVAAENITPVTLELGGNDAGIVLDDAKLDREAFRRLYLGAFMSSGQVCMALKRLYVHRSRYEEVVAGLTAECERQVIGDGLLPETTMGPMNNAKQLGVIRQMLKEAEEAGADLRELGQVPDPELYDKGYFQRPVLVLDPDPSLSVVKDEQFGPLLPIIPFDTEEDAVAMANDSIFGLCSSVWTEDRDRAVSLARKLEAGYTYINAHGPSAQDGRGPFGGFKQSGIGRNMGYEGIIAFQGYHCISAPAAPNGWLDAE
jgi:acyl-CoA reductase-like NAD-dependent aldehyde dehydrogenase